MNKDADDVFSIIDDFGVLNIDEDQISSMKRGDLQSLGEEFSNLLVLNDGSDEKLKELERILIKYASTNNNENKSKSKSNNENSDEIQESAFWASLSERDIQPIIIEALCFMLLGKESTVFNHGIILYSILLRMEPSSSIWNPTLFKPILSSLISTQQIIESGDKLNEQTKMQLELAKTLLTNLTFAVLNQNFLNAIGLEVLLAIDEIMVKLITGIRVEFDKYNESISNIAIKFIENIAKNKLNLAYDDILYLSKNEEEKGEEEEDKNDEKDEKENKDNEVKNVNENNDDQDRNEEEESDNDKKKKKKKRNKQKSGIQKSEEKSDNIDYLLPFLVPQLLLQFASSSNSITNRIDKIREKLTDLTINILNPKDYRAVIVCKHLICRAPEKSHLRRAVAHTVFKISKNSLYIKDIINFIIKASKTAKIGIRSFSSLLVQLFLNNIADISPLLGSESSEIVIRLSNVIKEQLNDQAPTVRSISLEGISLIIESISNKTNPFYTVINNIIDSNGYLEQILTKRISDEKLIVRKAALLCISQMIQCHFIPSKCDNNNNETNEDIFLINLIASRTRDRAVSIRQLAIRSLNSVVSLYKDNQLINLIWLDNVLPLIVDNENTVQNEALDSVTSNFLDPIIKGQKEIFTSIMTQLHFDFMKNVFTLYKQKAISLSKISKALTKNLKITQIKDDDDDEEIEDINIDISIWKLIEMLTRIEASHFKPNDFIKLWKYREKYNFPPEYYSILTNLKCTKKKIKNDCLRIVEKELQQNSRNFPLLHGTIQLLSIQEENADDFILKDLLLSCCNYINQMTQNDSTNEEDISFLMTTIYTLGEIVLLLQPNVLYDFNFTGLQLLISEKLPNGSEIPPNVRALSTISLGKLCIMRKDISNSFVSAFAHLLSSSNSDPSIKCDTLIVMCDLCVRYSALVDPHVVLMTNCFADESPIVRHQALHVITRLIAEDYLKMRPLLFFKYVFAITDEDEEVASFARCCLFNVLLSKSQGLLVSHFIDTIYYFSREIEIPGFFESEEENRLFQITDKERRQLGISLLVSKMNEITAFQMIQLICNNLLNRYVKEEFNIYDHKNILDDSIFSLIKLEDKMKQVMDSEILNEDQVTEKVVEAGKKMINDIHNNMIQNVLPILNFMLRKLRDLHSPLQAQLKQFYQRICIKNPNLIKQLKKSEPFLAAELQKEMESQIDYNEENEDDDENKASQSSASSALSTPSRKKKGSSFTTPLLSEIASTPRSQLCSPSENPFATPRAPK